MIRGLYSAASGLTSNLLLQDVVSENLAFSPVPGYKQAGVAFATFEDALANAASPVAEGQLLGTIPTQGYFNLEPGPLVPTGNPLDLATTNNVFFVLDSPAGPVFTRDGAFRLTGDGQLQNSAGLTVRGQGGTISIPQGTVQIVVTAEGRILADGVNVGQIQLEVIDNANNLTRVGPALFSGRQPNNPPPAGALSVEQGFLEGSNVNPISEMIGLLTNQRFYEASQRALRSLSDVLALQTRPDNNTSA
jgi:flagellar basal-body rod protein FlgG